MSSTDPISRMAPNPSLGITAPQPECSCQGGAIAGIGSGTVSGTTFSWCETGGLPAAYPPRRQTHMSKVVPHRWLRPPHQAPFLCHRSVYISLLIPHSTLQSAARVPRRMTCLHPFLMGYGRAYRGEWARSAFVRLKVIHSHVCRLIRLRKERSEMCHEGDQSQRLH